MRKNERGTEARLTATFPKHEVSQNGAWRYTQERDFRRLYIRRACTTCNMSTIAAWWNREVVDAQPCGHCAKAGA